MSLDLFDPPAPELSADEMARRRAHLRDEIERTRAGTRPGGYRSSRLWDASRAGGTVTRIGAAAVGVAIVAALAALLPGRLAGNQMTLVAQALAAIGNRPTIHVVLDYGGRPQLVDLKTGRTSSVDAQVAFWSDPKLGTLIVQTLDGRMIEQYRAGAANQAGPVEAWRAFVSGYRAQLRNGSYHVIGHGTLDGQPVEWIAGTPVSIGSRGSETEEVAISRSTYKPLLIRWRRNGHVIPRDSARVLVAETLPRNATLFGHHPNVSGSYTAFPNGSTGIRTTLRQARATMNPDPIVPPLRIANLERTWIGQPQMLIAPANSYRDQVPGVTLYYGHLDQYGIPAYKDSFIAITEVANPRYAHALWGPGLFRPGKAVLSNFIFGQTAASLKTHGIYLYIQANNRHNAIAAARALTR